MSLRPRHTRDERGIVTAELALGLPLLLAVTVGLVWLLSVGVAEVRVVDAAREAARSAARGDPDASAVADARQVAPGGSSVTLTHAGSQVRVEVEGRVAGPGGLFRFLPGVEVHADAVAADEASAS